MTQLNRWLSLGLVLLLGFMLGGLGFSLDKPDAPVERVTWSTSAQWIGPQTPNYRFYLRRSFDLADTAKAGWLRISADHDFNLYINGVERLRESSTLNNSLGLVSRLTGRAQTANDSAAYTVRTGVNYLLGNAQDWKLTPYVDLTYFLNPGKNTIAVEIQKGRKDPRVVMEGKIYPTQGENVIDLTTGATSWKVSSQLDDHYGQKWVDPDYPDQTWTEAKVLGPVHEATYSRMSLNLFDRPPQGDWITGVESPQGQVWLRSTWQVPANRKRAFIRFAAEGEYAFLINGQLLSRYAIGSGTRLHLYDVTNFLKPGANTLAVQLARPLDPDWSGSRDGSLTRTDSLSFFLDGWVETRDNTIAAPIATGPDWVTFQQPIPGWSKGVGEGQTVNTVKAADSFEFRRTIDGNAYFLNVIGYLQRKSLWLLGGTVFAIAWAWGLGQFWLGCKGGWWNSLAGGAGLLLPGNLFLMSVGLLKHRYAEEEQAFFFAQPETVPLTLLSFVGMVAVSLLWSRLVPVKARYRSRFAIPLLGWQPTYAYGGWSYWQPLALWFVLGTVTWMVLGLFPQNFPLTWLSGVFLVFVWCVGLVVTGGLSARLGWHLQDSLSAIKKVLPPWLPWLTLAIIVVIGFGLRVYNLDFTALDSDEATSYDAIRGILNTGTPEVTSHIWYTRGPAFHYMMALWLKLVGESTTNARFLMALWGTATILAAFLLTREITRNIWFRLTIAALIAFDPGIIWYSRFIRFYQPVQCLSLLAFWAFIKGFIQREGRFYQYCFFVIFTLMMLNQEVSLTLIPCFLLGFVCFYRPFTLTTDWRIWLSAGMSLVVVAYNIVFFTIKCLTPWVALSSTTDAYLKPNLTDITSFFAVFFIGPSRMHILYAFFFFLGFAFFLRRRDGKLTFLFSSVLLNLLCLSVLTYQVASRYTYAIYPLLIVLSVYSAFQITRRLGQRFELAIGGSMPLTRIALGFMLLLLLGNLEPDRTLAGYRYAIARHNPEVFEYIRDHRQPGDVVIANLPATAAVILKDLDYYLPPQYMPAFDRVYLRDGRLIDRWAGGVTLTNLDQVSQVLAKSKRVWIQLDDRRRPRGAPAQAEMSDYFQSLGTIVLDTYGVRLRLWEPKDGEIPRVSSQGQDLNLF